MASFRASIHPSLGLWVHMLTKLCGKSSQQAMWQELSACLHYAASKAKMPICASESRSAIVLFPYWDVGGFDCQRISQVMGIIK